MGELNFTSFELTGFNETIKALDSLSDRELEKILKKVLPIALRNKILNPEKAALPYSSRTERNIKIIQDKGDKQNLVYEVGPSSKSFWLRFLERGTKQRKTKSGKSLGAINARPIIEPTVDSNIPGLIEYINKETGNDINNILIRELNKKK